MSSSIGSGSALSQWYSLIRTPEATRVDKFAKDPQVIKSGEEFQSAVAKLQKPEDLFSPQNYKTLSYIMTAFGLESEVGNTGEIRQVLNSDLTDQNSLANRLNDPRYAAMAQALNLKAGGLTNLKDSSIQAGIVARNQQESYQVSLGQQNPALREAQYFIDNIANVKDIYSVMGDRTLRDVVSGAGNIPLEEAVQDVTSQATVFSKAFDVSRAKDPKYIASFVQRYLANADLKAAGNGQTDPSVALLSGVADQSGGSFDLSQISGINLLI
ncbi:MAG: DUF1217 domain-containing protein [Proteobacteria bacterium]|nr:DUF1217 domain-containing protein [Pseudomonadota bacterium]